MYSILGFKFSNLSDLHLITGIADVNQGFKGIRQ